MPGTDDEGSARPPNQGSLTQTGRRKRMRVFTPDDRATYRVVEKQRREALNTQFIELARLLPGLATTRRLSKSIIVTESIVHQKKQRDQRLACAQQIRAMRVEQESLLAEVNALRAQLGITERREGEPVSAEAAETLTVEEEVFGAFLAGISDNDDDANEGEDDVGGDLDEDRRGLSAVRRSRRSTSRSMSNASARSMSNTSNRASSRSPASSIGTRAWSAGPLNVSPSPPAQSEMSPAASTSDASSIAGTPPSAYDADFLAMFASPSPSILTTPLSFGFPPTNDMNAVFTAQVPPEVPLTQFGLRQSDVSGDYLSSSQFFAPPTPHNAPPPVENMWSFLQQHPGTEAMQNAGVFEKGLMSGLPIRIQYPTAFPPVHVGTHGGFTV